MITARLASYSRLNNGKVTSKSLRDAYKSGLNFDVQLIDKTGLYTSPQELKELGHKTLFIRFDHDRCVMELRL